jgi:hypothetical protein
MKSRFENPAPIPREQLEQRLASGDGPTVADALIRMSLWEADWRWAEQKTLWALGDGRKEVRIAALQSIGHLVRLHRLLNLEIVIHAATRLLDDADCRGAAADALDDIATFMPKAGGQDYEAPE